MFCRKIKYCQIFALCYDGVGCSVRDFVLAFFTYLLECSNGSLYAGWTVDLCKRIEQHNAGKGAKYTRALRPVRLKASWEFPSKTEAMSFEWHLKQLSRPQKLRLIEQSDKDNLATFG
jgi:putative endonuclease